MKRFIKTLWIVTLLASLAFSANKRVLKSEFKQDRMKRVEPDYRRGPGATRDACPHQYPENVNSVVTVIDSSTNGYGMVATVTRPMDVNREDENMLVVYRQYAGENTTHGQLGTAVSNNGDQWTIYNNINNCVGWEGQGGCQSGRYPSAIAAHDHPYIIWNEYTAAAAGWPADCSNYGGRPYYSYDQLGFMGGYQPEPIDIDPLWDCTQDFWEGSVGHGIDADDEVHISVVFNDWSRNGNYLFTSESVIGGYILFNQEVLIIDYQHLGTAGYSTETTLSMNDGGHGILGLIGILDGVDMVAGTCNPPASNTTCNKTPLFKLTDDWGEFWQPEYDSSFYYIPGEVHDDILSYWPSMDVDQCTGDEFEITGFWSWYEFDMRVDIEGNPHIITSMVAESDNLFHFIDGYTGFYHFTIDRDYIENPGPVNSSTGWNWSYIPIPASDSFRWNRPDGYSYLYGAMCQLSFSRENPDIVYAVANIGMEGEMSGEYDADGNGYVDDPCQYFTAPYELYPNWSEDIWITSSEDGGSTWTGLLNVTNTPRNGTEDECPPEEQYVHTAHWSSDDEVKFMYQQPDWGFNELGDPLGIDHKNRIFAGNVYRYGVYDECWMYFGYDGDVNLDYEINILDIVMLASHILEPSLEGCSLETADVNNDGELNILDIIAIINIILGS